MIKSIPKTALLSVTLALLSVLAHGQDVPAVSAPVSYQGFQLPSTLGTLSYSVSASENVRSGFYGNGNLWSTLTSGNLAYLSSSARNPFSMIYSGGLSFSNTQPLYLFQSLALSQVLKTRNFTLLVSDSLSYIPESSSSGLSGVPGAGDVGVPPPTVGGNDTQDILSFRGQRINNTASASISHPLTGRTGLNVSGSYSTQKSLSGSAGGLDTDQLSFQGGGDHRIDARTSLNLGYTYSSYKYGATSSAFITQGINLGFNRQLTRQLSFDISAGPQRSTSSSPTATGTSSSTSDLSIDGGLGYTGEVTSYSVRFRRGVQGGSGVLQGTVTNNLSLSAGRGLGPVWHVAFSGSYGYNQSLSLFVANPTTLQTAVGNLQLSRGIGRNLSGYLSYSALHQSVQGTAVTSNAFTGISNVVAMGITYSPRQLHLGHK